MHAAVAAQRGHLLRGGVEDGDAVAEDGQRELLARLGDDFGGDGLGAALARLDLDDGAFAGDADPEFAVAVEGAAGEARGEGEGLADLLEGGGVHLADQALRLVDDERAVVVEGDADAFAGDGLGRAGEGEGGEVDGADLAGGDVPQEQVGVGLLDLHGVARGVLEFVSGVGGGGESVDAGDLARGGGPQPQARVFALVLAAEGAGAEEGGHQRAYEHHWKSNRDEEALDVQSPGIGVESGH